MNFGKKKVSFADHRGAPSPIATEYLDDSSQESLVVENSVESNEKDDNFRACSTCKSRKSKHISSIRCGVVHSLAPWWEGKRRIRIAFLMHEWLTTREPLRYGTNTLKILYHVEQQSNVLVKELMSECLQKPCVKRFAKKPVPFSLAVGVVIASCRQRSFSTSSRQRRPRRSTPRGSRHRKRRDSH